MKKAEKTAIKVGAGLAAAASIAAAGYYFYASKDAKKHRKIAAKWATDLKNEVTKEAHKLERATPQAIHAIVDRVAKAYGVAERIDTAELKRAAKELKANWELLKKGAKKVSTMRARKAVKKAKKVVVRAKK